MSIGGVATSPSGRPRSHSKRLKELAIKHGHLGIEDHGVSAQPRDGLRQLREALGERLALAADELGRPTLLVGHHPVPVHLLFVDPASRWKGVEISVGCMSNRAGVRPSLLMYRRGQGRLTSKPPRG